MCECVFVFLYVCVCECVCVLQIMNSPPPPVFLEAVLLGVALVNGGNRNVQVHHLFIEHVLHSMVTLFFLFHV